MRLSSDFQVEAVNEERCAETLMSVSLMHTEVANCVNKVTQVLLDLESEIQAECVKVKDFRSEQEP